MGEVPSWFTLPQPKPGYIKALFMDINIIKSYSFCTCFLKKENCQNCCEFNNILQN